VEKTQLEEFRRAAGMPGTRYPEYRQLREGEGVRDEGLAATKATKELLAQMKQVAGLWRDYSDALREKGTPSSASGQADMDAAERVQQILAKTASTVTDAARFWLKP
jgi:hypothetical protein